MRRVTDGTGSPSSGGQSPTNEARASRIRLLEQELERKKLEKLRKSKEVLASQSPPGVTTLDDDGQFDHLSTKKRNGEGSLSDDEGNKSFSKSRGSLLGEEDLLETKKKRFSDYSSSGSIAAGDKDRRRKALHAFAAKIDWNDLRLVKKLGEGSFGVVWEGECFQGPVAIKVREEKGETSLSFFFLFAKEHFSLELTSCVYRFPR